MLSTFKTAVVTTLLLTASFADAREFNLAQMTEEEFGGVLRGARQNGETIYLPPSPQEDLVQRASLTQTGTGDFVYLSALNPNKESDSGISSAEVADLFQSFNRLSKLGFRTTVKMTASTADMIESLQATRPTIVVWTGHGNQQGIYDSYDRLPHDVFKKASPMVYQMIITSCFGRIALNEYYKGTVPSTMKTWGWDRLVYAADLGNFMKSADWSPLDNFPGEIKVKGLMCRKDAGGKFALFNGDNRLGLPIWATKESCLQRAQQSNESFACAPANDKGELGLFSTITGQVVEGNRYNNESKETCFVLPARAFNGKICRGTPKAPGSKEIVHRIVPAQTGLFDMSQDFKDYETCVNSILNSVDI